MQPLRLSPRERVHGTATDIADRVRDLFDLPGLEVTIIDLDERHTVLRVGRPPLRRVRLELAEARDILYRLPAGERSGRLVIGALLARDLAPVRQIDHWDLLIARIAWTLGQLGVGVEHAIVISDTISQAEGSID